MSALLIGLALVALTLTAAAVLIGVAHYFERTHTQPRPARAYPPQPEVFAEADFAAERVVNGIR